LLLVLPWAMYPNDLVRAIKALEVVL
jgi:hypothetical protein